MNAVSPRPTIAGTPSAGEYGWRRTFAALLIVEVALLIAYYATASAMVAIWWRSETFNHAFLVPPIALWLIWEKRHAIARARPQAAPWLALPFAGLAFAWLLGELAAVNAVTQLAFVAMLVLAVPLIVGLRAARVIAFPLAFLFFAVPIGEFIMPKLMDWTAVFTVAGLRATGIPVYQEGLHFVIPSGRWSVVEACSGVRYLIASVVVGTLYAYLNYRSLHRRLIFVGVAILVPLAANWLRAYIIVMLGHLSGNTIATGVDHLIYGWVFFGVVMAIMFAIGLRWHEAAADALPASPAGGNQAAQQSPTRWIAGMALALLVGLAPPVAMFYLDTGTDRPLPAFDMTMLAQDGWVIVQEPIGDWRPAYANPAATAEAVLVKNGRRIGVFIAWYRQRDYDSKLISSENQLVRSNDKNWAQVERGSRQANIAGSPHAVRTARLRNLGNQFGGYPLRLSAWHWYWIDGRQTASDHLGKLWQALSRLTGGGGEGAAVFVQAPEPDGDEAIAGYLASAGGRIDALLARTVEGADR
jgi:exosortase A